MSAVFITATGTDIGKTYVAAGLIRHWRGAGRTVQALKPVATGFSPESINDSDSAVLLAALGRAVTPAEVEHISPWRFTAALSPDMAAQRENRTVDFKALIDFTRHAVDATKGTLLIEGIGGVMVPLDERHTVLDWIDALGIPVLLVTGSYLGSLSHTLTALDALRARHIAVKSLLINETPGSTVTMSDTVQTLSRFTASIPIATLSRTGTEHAQAFAGIATRLDQAV